MTFNVEAFIDKTSVYADKVYESHANFDSCKRYMAVTDVLILIGQLVRPGHVVVPRESLQVYLKNAHGPHASILRAAMGETSAVDATALQEQRAPKGAIRAADQEPKQPLPASSGPEQTKLCEVAACHCGRQEAKQFVMLADGKEYAASEQCALNHLVAGYAIRPINTPAPAAKR